MYAVIKASGKQYKVAVGDEVLLDNMGLEPKSETHKRIDFAATFAEDRSTNGIMKSGKF